MLVYVFRNADDHGTYGATRDPDGHTLPGDADDWRSCGTFMLQDDIPQDGQPGIADIDVAQARADLDVLDFHIYRPIRNRRAG